MPDDQNEFDPDRKIKIKIPKDNGKSETVIRGSVNGQPYAVAVNQEVPVPAAVAQAIANSGITFEVVDEEGAGLPSASTAPLTDTATRLAPAQDPLQPTGDGAPQVATLQGGDGDTGVGAGGSTGPDTARDLDEGMTNADGQGVAAAGGPRVGNDVSDKASSDVGGGTDGADKPTGDQDQAETVDQLKDRIGKIDDVAALRAEHDAETDGRKRTTALTAIDARIDALTKQA